MEARSVPRNDPAQGKPLSALDRSLDVLEAVLAEAPDAALASIAVRTGLPKPTVHRILGVLTRRKYVTAIGRGRYSPGVKVLTAAGLAHAAIDYTRVVYPHLQRLREHTVDTIHVGLLLGDHAVYVAKFEGTRPYRMVSAVGMRLALHSTAIGKAILAYAPDRNQLLDRITLEAHTLKTITDVPVLQAALDEVLRRGFAIDDEENEEGVRCIGAPVFGYRGEILGAISVSAPAIVFTLTDALALAPEVMAAANAVSMELGAPGDASGQTAGPTHRHAGGTNLN